MASASAQQARLFEAVITKRARLEYLLFLPAGYGDDRAKRWPLVLFLHGAGERGDDLAAIKKHGLPKILDSRTDFPAVVVSPQCPADDWWTNQLDTLIALLDDVSARYSIDPERVYLTGLSMGGFGSWALGAVQPRRFAAIVPICGGGTRSMALRLKDVPVWAFDGAKDDVVPLARSEELVEALRQAGGNARLTVYPGAGHDSWTETYDNPEVFSWMFNQRRDG